MVVNFPWLKGSESAERGRERLKSLLIQEGVFPIPTDYASKWVTHPAAEWMPKAPSLFRILMMLITEVPTEAAAHNH
jgi:hypothetical protein